MLSNYRIDLYKKRLVPIAVGAITLNNGDFASGISSWTGGTGWSGVTDSGQPVAYFSGATSTPLAQRFSNYIPTPGVWYDVNYRVKCSGSFYVAINDLILTANTSTAGVYQTRSIPFLAQSGGTTTDTLIFSAQGATSAYLDDVYITRNLERSPAGFNEEFDAWKTIELQDDLPMPLNYSIAPISEFGKLGSNYSKTIEVPGTANNNAVFSDISNPSSGFEYYKFKQRYRAVLWGNDQNLFDGFLQYLEVGKQGGSNLADGEVTHKVRLFSESKNFFETMKNDYLNDLDWSELNHTFGFNAIKRTNSGGTWNDGYFYPVPYTNNPNSYVITDFSPGIYVRYALEKIASRYNYRLNIHSGLTQHWNNYIIPFTGKRQTIDTTDVVKNSFNVFETGTFALTGITQDYAASPSITLSTFPNFTQQSRIEFDTSNSGDYYIGAGLNGSPVYGLSSDSYYFRAPQAGKYTFDFSLNIEVDWDLYSYSAGTYYDVVNNPNFTNVAGMDGMDDSHLTLRMFNDNTPVDTQIKKWRSSEILTSASTMSGVKWFYPTGPYIGQNNRILNFSGTSTYDMAAGGLIRLHLSNVRNSHAFLSGSSSTQRYPEMKLTLQPNSFFRSTMTAQVGEGNLIEMNSWIKKMKCKELFENLAKAHRLFMWAEPGQRVINITSGDQYYSDPSKEMDWSDLVEADEEITIELFKDVTDKSINFTYSPGKDYWNESHQNKNGDFVFGNYVKEFSSDFADGDTSIKLSFVPTPIVQTYNGAYVPAIDAANNVDCLRLLYVQEVPSSAYTFAIETQDINANTQLLVEMPYYKPALHSNSITAPTFDLNFGDVGNSMMYDPCPLSSNNLYQSNWRNWLNLVNDGKVMTANFKLTEAHISKLKNDLSYKIWVDGQRWIISQIHDYIPTWSYLTKVSLVKWMPVSGLLFDVEEVRVPSLPGSINVTLPNTQALGPAGSNIGEYAFNTEGEVFAVHLRNSISSLSSRAFGYNNTIGYSAVGAVAVGSNNSIYNSTPSLIVGDQNSVGGENRNVFIVGSGNTLSSSLQSAIMIGVNNVNTSGMTGSSYVNLGGMEVLDGEVSIGSGRISLGDNLIVGSGATTTSGTSGVFAVGNDIDLSGYSASTSILRGTQVNIAPNSDFSVGGKSGEITLLINKYNFTGGTFAIISTPGRSGYKSGMFNVTFETIYTSPGVGTSNFNGAFKSELRNFLFVINSGGTASITDYFVTPHAPYTTTNSATYNYGGVLSLTSVGPNYSASHTVTNSGSGGTIVNLMSKVTLMYMGFTEAPVVTIV